MYFLFSYYAYNLVSNGRFSDVLLSKSDISLLKRYLEKKQHCRIRLKQFADTIDNVINAEIKYKINEVCELDN